MGEQVPVTPRPGAAAGQPLDVVWWACRAPSVHNTQPWRWSVEGHTIRLHADPSRRLRGTDRVGRDLVISGGAAVHHAIVAAQALGWEVDLQALPDPEDPTFLACLLLTPGDPAPDDLTLRAIEARSTDRRGFTSWPVPDATLRRLGDVAEAWGTRALPLVAPAERELMPELARRALGSASIEMTDEAAQWRDHGRFDGVPSGALPVAPAEPTRALARFGMGTLVEAAGEDPEGAGWIVLAGAYDDAVHWLRTGEGLSALWLEAQRTGLAVQPVSNIVETDETFRLLHEALGWIPHLALRVGWPSSSAPRPPETPRRPLSDVVDPR